MKRVLTCLGLAVSLALGTAFCGYAQEITVTYEQLGELLEQGSLALQDRNDSYDTSLENYKTMLAKLREEQEYMKFLAEKYEEDEETAAVYSSNANALGVSAARITRRLDLMYRKSQTGAVERNVNTFLVSAQSQMNAYNQMLGNVAAKEKRVEAAEAAWQAALRRQTAGMAAASEVLEASDTLNQEKNQLTSYRQQASRLRFSLLSLLGLETEEAVVIGGIPEPDLETICAVDYEKDKMAAINNNSQVQSVRHARAGTTSELERKVKAETEAVGMAEADFRAACQELEAGKTRYLASLDSYESRRLDYQALQGRKQAGMITQTEYLQGEATYQEALAAKNTAAMNLVQAFETYRWCVKGL